MTRGDARHDSEGRSNSLARRLGVGAGGAIIIGGAVLMGGAASLVTAFANSGTVSATQDCKTWSVDVDLHHDVTNRYVTVHSTIPGTTDYAQSNVTTTGNADDSDFKDYTGTAPQSGTVTLTVYYSAADTSGGVESTAHDTLPSGGECNTPDLTTKLSSSSMLTTGTVTDQATLSGQDSDDTGTVTYNVYSGSTASACTGTPLQHSTKTLGAGTIPASGAFTLAAGSYEFQAVYSGDSENAGATSACGSEPLSVQNQPAVTTALSTSSVTLPGTVSDQATITGATSDAGGTVTYNLYSGSTGAACVPANLQQHSAKTVTNGVAPVSDAFTLAAGSYEAQAVYSGDAKNKGAMSVCDTEPLTVSPSPTPSGNGGVQAITTTPPTPSTGSSASLTGITVGGLLLLGGLCLALLGSMVPRRRRQLP